MKLKGSKRFGIQACDACGRDFDVVPPDGWRCPRCGFDNRAGRETYMHLVRVAAKASAAMRKGGAK